MNRRATGWATARAALLAAALCAAMPARAVHLGASQVWDSIPPAKGHAGEQEMVASWYGIENQNGPTANGGIYNMYGLTAAHKTLPFGTILLVRNPENGRTVEVTITDRGPFIAGRDLDLSFGAAQKLGLVDQGVGTVYVTTLGRASGRG